MKSICFPSTNFTLKLTSNSSIRPFDDFNSLLEVLPITFFFSMIKCIIEAMNMAYSSSKINLSLFSFFFSFNTILFIDYKIMFLLFLFLYRELPLGIWIASNSINISTGYSCLNYSSRFIEE